MRIKKEWKRVFHQLAATVNKSRPRCAVDVPSGQIAWCNDRHQTIVVTLEIHDDAQLQLSSMIRPWRPAIINFVNSRGDSMPAVNFEVCFTPDQSESICQTIIAKAEKDNPFCP